MKPKFVGIMISVLLAAGLSQCASTVRLDNGGVQTDSLSGGSEPLILAARDARCSEAVTHRRVYWPFVVPVNDLDSEQKRKIARVPSIRVTEKMRWSDIGLSAVGFLVGVVTRTTVYESCGADVTLVSRKSRREAASLREANREMNQKLEEAGREIETLRERLAEIEKKAAEKSALSIPRKETKQP